LSFLSHVKAIGLLRNREAAWHQVPKTC